MKINVKTRITQTENSNSIEVVFEQSTKRSVTSMNKIIIYSSSLETNEDTKATIAHEFGHIFGLADAYLESGVFNYSCIEFVNSITGSIKTAQRPMGCCHIIFLMNHVKSMCLQKLCLYAILKAWCVAMILK